MALRGGGWVVVERGRDETRRVRWGSAESSQLIQSGWLIFLMHWVFEFLSLLWMVCKCWLVFRWSANPATTYVTLTSVVTPISVRMAQGWYLRATYTDTEQVPRDCSVVEHKVNRTQVYKRCLLMFFVRQPFSKSPLIGQFTNDSDQGLCILNVSRTY